MRTITIEQGTKDSRYTWNNSETKQEPKAKKKKNPRDQINIYDMLSYCRVFTSQYKLALR